MHTKALLAFDMSSCTLTCNSAFTQGTSTMQLCLHRHMPCSCTALKALAWASFKRCLVHSYHRRSVYSHCASLQQRAYCCILNCIHLPDHCTGAWAMLVSPDFYGVAFAQQMIVKGKGRVIPGNNNLHMHCCMLYEPLQVLAQGLVCCLHKLSSVTGKLIQTASFRSIWGK